MEYTTINNNYFDDEPEEDALSLCDLPLTDETENLPSSSSSSSSDGDDQDAFEFSTDTESDCRTLPPLDGVVFCGKSIPLRKPLNHNNNSIVLRPAVPTQKPPRLGGPFCLRSESFKMSRAPASHFATRSKSVRFPPAKGSSSSRKHKVLIGPAKFPSTMELSDIRKRQDRLAPVMKFPVVDGGQPLVSGEGKGLFGGLLRPMRFRSSIVGALARACFGCMPRV
ncbi:hypothetical protein FNV43_RR25004 [Rhamnella rubrinervis]|uniref:Uncharacterized protein n=1 Tax=Rhamnella rubrinervis TaxID=2594499 RepID=A0A8K0GQS4_9ROSA|nr:hypothetical protein FNV43_RR25004 [Rhamnella rubrinervis]